MTTNTETHVPGRLVSIGAKPLGVDRVYEWWECVDCGTQYPSRYGKINPTCNGHAIAHCPWCSSYSKPWTNGRGK